MSALVLVYGVLLLTALAAMGSIGVVIATARPRRRDALPGRRSPELLGTTDLPLPTDDSPEEHEVCHLAALARHMRARGATVAHTRHELRAQWPLATGPTDDAPRRAVLLARLDADHTHTTWRFDARDDTPDVPAFTIVLHRHHTEHSQEIPLPQALVTFDDDAFERVFQVFGDTIGAYGCLNAAMRDQCVSIFYQEPERFLSLRIAPDHLHLSARLGEDLLLFERQLAGLEALANALHQRAQTWRAHIEALLRAPDVPRRTHERVFLAALGRPSEHEHHQLALTIAATPGCPTYLRRLLALTAPEAIETRAERFALYASGVRDASTPSQRVRCLERLLTEHPDEPETQDALIDHARILDPAALEDPDLLTARAPWLERVIARYPDAPESELARARLLHVGWSDRHEWSTAHAHNRALRNLLRHEDTARRERDTLLTTALDTTHHHARLATLAAMELLPDEPRTQRALPALLTTRRGPIPTAQLDAISAWLDRRQRHPLDAQTITAFATLGAATRAPEIAQRALAWLHDHARDHEETARATLTAYTSCNLPGIASVCELFIIRNLRDHPGAQPALRKMAAASQTQRHQHRALYALTQGPPESVALALQHSLLTPELLSRALQHALTRFAPDGLHNVLAKGLPDLPPVLTVAALHTMTDLARQSEHIARRLRQCAHPLQLFLREHPLFAEAHVEAGEALYLALLMCRTTGIGGVDPLLVLGLTHDDATLRHLAIDAAAELGGSRALGALLTLQTRRKREHERIQRAIDAIRARHIADSGALTLSDEDTSTSGALSITRSTGELTMFQRTTAGADPLLRDTTHQHPPHDDHS